MVARKGANRLRAPALAIGTSMTAALVLASPIRTRLLIAALLIAEICSALEVTMIYTATPSLNRQFGNPAAVGWIVTACLLVSSATAAVCGRLGDLYGHKRVMMTLIALSGFGSLTSAFSSSLSGIIVGAGLQGASGAILALCLALIREYLPPSRVPATVGIVLAAATASAAAGLAIGGVLIDNFGWQSIFWASGAWAAFSLLVAWLWVPPRSAVTPSRKGVDLLRGILFAPAIAALLLALTFTNDHPITDPLVWVTASTALCILVYWARHQLTQQNPLINLRLFADRRVATAYFCVAMIGMGAMQHTLIMSMMLQQPATAAIGFGLAAGVAGLLLMPVRLAGVVASPVSGWIASRYGPRCALLLGGILGLAGWSTILLFNHSLYAILFGMVLEGTGFSVSYVAIPVILLQAAPPGRAGEVNGLSSVFRAAFAAIGTQIVMLILNGSTERLIHSSARYPTERAFQFGIGFVLITGFACLVAGYTLRDDRPRL